MKIVLKSFMAIDSETNESSAKRYVLYNLIGRYKDAGSFSWENFIVYIKCTGMHDLNVKFTW